MKATILKSEQLIPRKFANRFNLMGFLFFGITPVRGDYEDILQIVACIVI